MFILYLRFPSFYYPSPLSLIFDSLPLPSLSILSCCLIVRAPSLHFIPPSLIPHFHPYFPFSFHLVNLGLPSSSFFIFVFPSCLSFSSVFLVHPSLNTFLNPFRFRLVIHRHLSFRLFSSSLLLIQPPFLPSTPSSPHSCSPSISLFIVHPRLSSSSPHSHPSSPSFLFILPHPSFSPPFSPSAPPSQIYSEAAVAIHSIF